MGVHGTLVLNVDKLFETMKTGLGHGKMKSSVMDLSVTNHFDLADFCRGGDLSED